MKEYPLSKGYKVTGFLFGVAFILGGLWVVWHVFDGGYHDRGMWLHATIIGIGLVLVGVWMFHLALRLSVIVNEDSLTVRQAFTVRSIALKDIKGFRIASWKHLVIAVANGGRKLHLPAGLRHHNELVAWIMMSYPDSDEEEKAAETEELLKDERFGVSRQARGAALEKARKLGPVSHVMGILLCFWPIFYPKPYELMMGLLLSAPVIYSNCRYDHSDAKVYPAHILRKQTSSSYTSTSFHLELSRWGKYPDGNDVEVGKSLYDAVTAQNTVCVLLFKGEWGIPWYTVVRCE